MPRQVAERADILPKLAEIFRKRGYEGASLSEIGAATGLGKGSLYHFFPGGKPEMAESVLAEVDAWFEGNIFAPLRAIPAGDAAEARQVTIEAIDLGELGGWAAGAIPPPTATASATL